MLKLESFNKRMLRVRYVLSLNLKKKRTKKEVEEISLWNNKQHGTYSCLRSLPHVSLCFRRKALCFTLIYVCIYIYVNLMPHISPPHPISSFLFLFQLRHVSPFFPLWLNTTSVLPLSPISFLFTFLAFHSTFLFVTLTYSLVLFYFDFYVFLFV